MQGIDPAGNDEDSAVGRKTDYAVTAISILRDFGLHDLVQRLCVRNGVHRLGNLLSLEPSCHIHFDRLNLWFESTGEPNRYHVCVARRGIEAYLRMSGHLQTDSDKRLYVQFPSGNDESQEPPDSQLLALHAVCARVAHMSGAVPR